MPKRSKPYYPRWVLSHSEFTQNIGRSVGGGILYCGASDQQQEPPVRQMSHYGLSLVCLSCLRSMSMSLLSVRLSALYRVLGSPTEVSEHTHGYTDTERCCSIALWEIAYLCPL